VEWKWLPRRAGGGERAVVDPGRASTSEAGEGGGGAIRVGK
jgi:hypothetical protein